MIRYINISSFIYQEIEYFLTLHQNTKMQRSQSQVITKIYIKTIWEQIFSYFYFIVTYTETAI